MKWKRSILRRRWRTRALRARGGVSPAIVMIVVAVVALGTAVAVPKIHDFRISMNERSAVGSIRAFVRDLKEYRSRYGEFPATFLELEARGYSPEHHFGVGEPRLRRGYEFTYRPLGIGTFLVSATPEEYGETGLRRFVFNADPKQREVYPLGVVASRDASTGVEWQAEK
ncbi:MAG: hypothetical protein AAF517_09215 [Planctomycetota bacterium]